MPAAYISTRATVLEAGRNARRRTRLSLAPYLYLTPALLLFFVFIVYPISHSLISSFFEWDGLSAGKFVGAANYRDLFQDANFWNSLKITITWVFLSGVLLPLTALVLALLIEFGAKSRLLAGLARTILFVPMTISFVAVGLLFTLFYNPVQGVLNSLLQQFGILSELDLLGDPNTTVPSIFLVALWQWSGFGMVIFSAALAGVPSDLYDAARIDGATQVQFIRHILLPLLTPTYLLVLTINVIGGFKAFDLIYVMTAGGPSQASETTSIFLYKQAFTLHRFGYGSTTAMVLCLIIVIATMLLTWLRKA